MNGSFFENLLGTAAGYYNQDKASQAALELGERGAQELSRLGTEVAGMAEFKPFTVTTGLGTTTTTPTGGIDVGLTPEQQALQSQLLSQATGLFGQVGVDPSMAQADLYEQMRAVQRPEEERQRLALEERMLSQGRLGLQSSAYGGSSPELLAQETARQEAMARASLGARTQAMQEQQQAYGQGLGLLGQASGMRQRELAEALGLQGAGYVPQQQQLAAATGLMGLGYMPQQQMLGALGYGLEGAKLSDIGRRTGAELYGQAGAAGIEALMKGLQEASAYDLGMTQQAVGGITSGMLTDGEGGAGWGVDLATKLIDYFRDDDDNQVQSTATGINQPNYRNYA